MKNKIHLKENLIMLIFSTLSESRKYHILRRVQENIKDSSAVKINFIEINK